MSAGFFAIGIWHPKSETNIGTLWRSAYALGAAFIFTIGRRYEKQASDTAKTWRALPLFHFDTVVEMVAHLPYDCLLVGVELDARSTPIANFAHPQRCVYLLGAEDHGLPAGVRNACHRLVQLPGRFCLNVASAGTVTMFDRLSKSARSIATPTGAPL